MSQPPITRAQLLGTLVDYLDANGNLLPAIVTAVRDITTGKVDLTVFSVGAMTFVTGIVYDPIGSASTWRGQQSRDGKTSG